MFVKASLFGSALLAIACGACGACGGGQTVIPTTPTPVAPVDSSRLPTPSSTNVDLSDIPAVGAPKPLQPAKVSEIASKGPVKGIAIASKNLPIVYLRIVVRAGHAQGSIMSAPTKSRAGIAELTAQLLKDGGAGAYTGTQLADRVDALGADLSVDVGLDRVVFGISVTKDKLDVALELLSTMVLSPRFDPGEFAKLKARELDRVRQAQKGSGSWIARLALYRELYGKGHPYAEVDATEESLANIDLADVRAFYKKAYVAAASFAVVAGDVDAADLAPRLDKHLSRMSTQPAPQLPASAAPAGGSETRKIVLALKPDAKQADIFVGALAIPRSDPHWPELALALHALGGGMASRLFLDVREKRSLAYSTSASSRELAFGPSLISLYAGTKSASTPESLGALLENLQWIAKDRPISDGELSMAKTSLETGFVFRLETIGSVAGLAIDKAVLGLPGNDVYDYVASYRKSLHDASLESVRTMAAERLHANSVVIAIAGDRSLAKPLTRFAAVRVVDPEKGFSVVEQLPFEPK